MEQYIDIREPSLMIGQRTVLLLRGIARAAMSRAPDVAARLLDEVDRAEVVTEGELPAGIVTIGSTVTYRVRPTGSVNTIQLVRPHEADLAKMRVSIVSEIGAALIGLGAGQQIQWELGGRQYEVEVISVSRGPASAEST